MPLQGSLKEMSLANLIQVNCQEMRSARLTLTNRGQTGEVFMSDGQVVHAAFGSSVGEEALYELLMWEEGSFVLDLELPPPARTIETQWQELLLKGMMVLPVRAAPEKQPTETAPAGILSRLKAIEGVTGAVISSSDGVVLSTDIPESDGEREAAVTVFVGSAAAQLGQTLRFDAFAHGVVVLKNKRILILEQPDRYVGLVLGETASPAIVASAAELVFKK